MTHRRPALGARYWRVWTASAVSNLGDGVDVAALPLYAASLTRDPRLVAGLAVAAGLPWLFFALPAGAIVDRLDRKQVMWRANVVRGVLVALIGLSAATGHGRIWVLYAIALGLGICETLFDNAAQALLPTIVAGDLLEAANGRQYAAEVAGNQFVGPPLGGVLFSVAVALPFWFDSASFFVSAALIATLAGTFRVRGRAPTAEGRRSLRSEIAEGVHWLRSHRLLRTLALLLGLLNLTASVAFSTFVLFAQERLGVGARGYGVLLTGMAVGSVAGGLLGARFAERLGQARALVVAALVTGGIPAAIGLSSRAVVVGVLLAVWGLFIMVWNIVTVSLRQQIVPAHLLGRVNSVYRFLGWGGIPIGALVGGLIAGAAGLRVPWLVSGAVGVAGVLVGAPIIRQSTIDAARAEAAS